MTDWATYLAGFHTCSPGIAEDVLGWSPADGLSPYGRLAERAEESESGVAVAIRRVVAPRDRAADGVAG